MYSQANHMQLQIFSNQRNLGEVIAITYYFVTRNVQGELKAPKHVLATSSGMNQTCTDYFYMLVNN